MIFHNVRIFKKIVETLAISALSVLIWNALDCIAVEASREEHGQGERGGPAGVFIGRIIINSEFVDISPITKYRGFVHIFGNY